MNELKKYIRSVKDFPKQGIMFRDITTLLKDPQAMKIAFDELLNHCKGKKITKVAGIESRGFIFGSMLASELNVGFIPIRKPGKLPAEVISEYYELEYGTDKIEMHKDAISDGDVVLLHDDLLATGGTAKAAANLIEKAGGRIAQISFLIELTFLNGREKLREFEVVSIVQYEDEI